ncbi:hypothetical protein ABC502_09970 [Alkalimonas sp. NCh-2]|uniref:hypothetical protein n=1 Tax=Alkalimonas sp. NCh-2 TaxID=3144846 RepID=UPI0031F6D31A
MYYRLFAILIFLTGCTSQVWQAPSYDEHITGFYGVADEDLLIVTGKKYSYIFEASDKFKNILALSRSMDFTPVYSTFKLDKENNVAGEFTLVAVQPSNVTELRALGFVDRKYRPGNMEIIFPMTGKRYVVDGDYPFEQLAGHHYVLVEMPVGGADKAGKIIATPAAIVVDAVVAIPVMSIFAIGALIN